MKPLFVDTSALIALGNGRDQFHAQAVMLFKEYSAEKRRFVTTNAILLEMTNAFSAAPYKPLAIRLFELIETSPAWTVVMIDRGLMARGWAKFEQMADKDWSLVDCISMIVAQDAGMTEIFTNDHHFQQAGLIMTLK